MLKNLAVTGAVISLAVFLFSYQNATLVNPPSEQPNIIYIMLDDAGYADFINPEIYKPNIDLLEEKALKFTHFYTNPTCSPTRVSIMTGRNPARFGIEHALCLPEINVNEGTARGIPKQMPTLPKALKKAGYHSTHIGKWHLGERIGKRAADQGFDDTIVYQFNNHGFRDPLIHTFKENRLVSSRRIIGHKTNILTDKALHFLKTRDKTKPFFLNMWYNDPHNPNQPESQWIAKYTDQFASLPAKHQDKILYFGAISQVDYNIGRILRAVENDPELAKNTIIFLTSDNGGSNKPGNYSNYPLKGSKGSTFEGGIRVPLYAYWPGVLKAGHSNDSPLRSSDIFSTFIDLSGQVSSGNQESKTFADILLDGRGGTSEVPRKDLMFWHQRGQMPYCGRWEDFMAQDGWRKASWIQAIRDGKWKYVSHMSKGEYKEYLFDFSQTESEDDSVNLASTQPSRLQEMRNKLDGAAIRRSRIGTKINNSSGDVTVSNRTVTIGQGGGRAQIAPHDLLENHDGSFTFALKIKPHTSLKNKTSLIAQRKGSWEIWLQQDRKIRLNVVDEDTKKTSTLLSKTAVNLGMEYNLAFTIAGHVGGEVAKQEGNCLKSDYVHNVARLYIQSSANTELPEPEAIDPRHIYNVAVSGYDNPIYLGKDAENKPATQYAGTIYFYGAHSLEMSPRQLAAIFKEPTRPIEDDDAD